MRYKKVLFIIPNLGGFYGWPNYPHPGIGYLTSVLEEHNIQTYLWDMNLNKNYNDLAQTIAEFEPELIGITTYTFCYKKIYQLVGRIKKGFSLPIIIGGPHVSFYRKEAMEKNLIDFAIKYEGEYPLLKLSLGEAFDRINNLLYWKDNSIVENTTEPFIKELDSLPFPKYNKVDLAKYRYQQIGIVSSRGCPYRCIYCATEYSMGKKYRYRSAQNVFEEIAYWYQKGIKNFNFIDDTFIQNTKRILDLCDLIENANFKDLSLGASNGIRADRAIYHILKRMRDVGFCTIGFGVESVDNQILKSIKKNLTIEQIDEAIKNACELGFDVKLFFMLGFEGDTPETVKKSFDFALKYPVTTANFYNIIPYPGTELFEYLKSNNLLLYKPEDYLNSINKRMLRPIFRIKSMTLKMKKKLLRQGLCVSRLVNRKHRKRQYRKSGLLGSFFAWFLTTELMYNKMMAIKNVRLGKLFDVIFHKFVPLKKRQ